MVVAGSLAVAVPEFRHDRYRRRKNSFFLLLRLCQKRSHMHACHTLCASAGAGVYLVPLQTSYWSIAGRGTVKLISRGGQDLTGSQSISVELQARGTFR